MIKQEGPCLENRCGLFLQNTKKSQNLVIQGFVGLLLNYIISIRLYLCPFILVSLGHNLILSFGHACTIKLRDFGVFVLINFLQIEGESINSYGKMPSCAAHESFPLCLLFDNG